MILRRVDPVSGMVFYVRKVFDPATILHRWSWHKGSMQCYFSSFSPIHQRPWSEFKVHIHSLLYNLQNSSWELEIFQKESTSQFFLHCLCLSNCLLLLESMTLPWAGHLWAQRPGQSSRQILGVAGVIAFVFQCCCVCAGRPAVIECPPDMVQDELEAKISQEEKE